MAPIERADSVAHDVTVDRAFQGNHVVTDLLVVAAQYQVAVELCLGIARIQVLGEAAVWSQGDGDVTPWCIDVYARWCTFASVDGVEQRAAKRPAGKRPVISLFSVTLGRREVALFDSGEGIAQYPPPILIPAYTGGSSHLNRRGVFPDLHEAVGAGQHTDSQLDGLPAGGLIHCFDVDVSHLVFAPGSRVLLEAHSTG